MAKIRLLPHDEKFFELFDQAASIGVQGVEALHAMLQNFDQADDYRKQIADLEHAGDKVIHSVVDKLNRTFITPLDQEDIRAVASRLDDIIDFTQASAERLVLYHVTSPCQECIDLTGILLQTAKEVQTVIGLLHDLSQSRAILEHCIEINRLENQGDHIYRQALGKLFADGDILELIRWKEIFEQIEEAIDQCEDLADVIESIVVKHS